MLQVEIKCYVCMYVCMLYIYVLIQVLQTNFPIKVGLQSVAPLKGILLEAEIAEPIDSLLTNLVLTRHWNRSLVIPYQTISFPKRQILDSSKLKGVSRGQFQI